MTAAAARRTRAKWIAVLCALAAVLVGVAGARHAIRFVRESRAIAALGSKDEAERREVLRKLAELRSARAVPAILSTMPSDYKGARAIRPMELGDEKSAPWEALCSRAIQEIGLVAIPALRRALGSPDAAERFWSVVMLMRFAEKGRRDPDAALRSLLDDSDGDVRSFAALAVGLSAAKNHRLLESLVTDLKGPQSSENLRISAARAIGTAAAPYEARMRFERMESAAALEEEKSVPSPEMTSAMRSAALALLEAAQSPSERSTFATFEGLCAIERRCSFGDLNLKGRIHDILRRWLAHEDAAIRLWALRRIVEPFDTDHENLRMPPEIVEALGPLLLDEDQDVRKIAAAWLSRPEGLPVLLRVLDQAASVRSEEALDGFKSMRGEAEMWTAIFEHLVRADGSVSDTAVYLLAAMGEMDGVGMDHLSDALVSKEPGIRRAAVRILARYHASRSVDDSVLSPLLLDEDEEVLSHAAAALSATGNLEAEVFEARVLKLLDPSKPASVRLAACRAAQGLGPKAVQAVPAVVVAAQGELPQLAAAAIEALSVISADESIPLSIRAMGHEDRGVRDAAITALWTVGSAASRALPALRRFGEEEKDLELAKRAATLVRRLESEEGRPPEVRR